MIPSERLAGLELFRGVDARVVVALAKRGIEVSFAPDTVLFLAGSAPRGWYIVLEGLVRVVRGSNARQHVIHTEGPGGTLGEVPLFTDEMHPATGIAAEPTRCALFDKTSLLSAIAECPEIAFLINRRLALRVRDLVARLDDRSSRSVHARLARFLLDRASATERDIVSVGMTQQDLAEELGTAREVVSREMRRLARDGVIKALGGGKFRVLSDERLKGEADRL